MKLHLGSRCRWMAPAAVALLASLSVLPAFARDGGRDHHDRSFRGGTNVQVLIPDVFSGHMVRGTRPDDRSPYYNDPYYNDQYYNRPDWQRYQDRDDYRWDRHDRDRWDRDRHDRDRHDGVRHDRDHRDQDDHRGDRW